MTISATHRAQAAGAPTYADADPAAPPGPRLDPFLEVEVLETRGSWSRIRCENGWEAWADGRWLEPIPPPAAVGVASAPAAPAPPPPAPSLPTPSPVAAPAPAVAPVTVAASSPSMLGGLPLDMAGWLVLGGSLLGVLGAFLPWYTASGFSVNAFDLAMWSLMTNNVTATDPTAGVVILLGAALGILWVLLARRGPSTYVLLVISALVVFSPAMYAFARWVRDDGVKPDLGVGLLLSFCGGLLAFVGAWLTHLRRSAS